ncbi:MAG: hypothetical protein F7B61_03345 [Caldisphaeraceae archaeon]|nr:hypothetical protein [Caldisphaeraceae archaeon]
MKLNSVAIVKFEGNRLSVDGRNYNSTHALILGAEKLAGEIEEERLRIEAYFRDKPQVDNISEETIKISSFDSEFAVDSLGRRLESATELEEGYLLAGELVTVKFESDESSSGVIIKLPKVGSLKVNKFYVDLRGHVSSNIISSPFVIGEITVKGPTRIKVQVSDNIARITDYNNMREEYTEEKKVVNRSTPRNNA